MKKFLSLAAAVAAVCLMTTACTKNDEEPTLAHHDDVVQAQIASLNQQIQALEKTVEALQTAMDAADNQLKTELEPRIATLEQLYQQLNDAIAALPETPETPETPEMPDMDDIIGRLQQLEQFAADSGYDSLAQLVTEVKSRLEALEANPDEEAVKALLAELETALRTEINQQNERVVACENLVGSMSDNISAMQTQIEALQSDVDGKVGRDEYETFAEQTRRTNETVQQNLETLAELSALCGGFDDGATVKGYIDSAVDALTSALGDYALKSEYTTFYNEYKTFAETYQTDKTAIEAQIAALKDMIAALDPDTPEESPSLGDLTDLTLKVAALEAKSHSLEDVYDKFTAECSQFKSGVDAVIEQALADDGKITAAIRQALDSLLGDYVSGLDNLTQRMAQLEGRLDSVEEQLQDVVGRIQSLVYVPKTSDGKIHVGTTYIAVNDDDENRIEVTPTKKLEYRVSPAELSDKLALLPTECFTFWQEHVTRAEGDGSDEFRVIKVEAGNGPGEILLTVENHHDFAYRDLAVALCIRTETASGVKTEYTSPYTTVVGDGRNIYGRFYLARRTTDGYAAVYGDEITCLMLHNDTSSTASLLGSDYEVVYDNGESVMSLADAKERFEWDVDLTWNKTGIEGAFSTNSMMDVVTVPTKPNEARETPVTVRLSVGHSSNIGKAVSDAYRITLTDGETTVTLRERTDVKLLVCDDKYVVEGEPEVVWNYNKWEAAIGRAEGDYTPYLTQASHRIAASHEIAHRYNHLPESVVSEMFSPTAVWAYTGNEAINGELEIGNTLPVQTAAATGGSAEWRVQFTVGGYKYNDGTQAITSLWRDVRPAHLVGTKPIRLECQKLKFDAPEARSITLTGEVKATSATATLFYLAVSEHISNVSKKLKYTDEEVKKYFGGNTSNLSSSELLSNYSANFTALQGTDNTYSLPVKVVVTSIDAADAENSAAASIYRYPALVSTPRSITPSPLTDDMVFTVPADAQIAVKDGPTFKVTGSVTVKSGSDDPAKSAE